jgi:RNA polymerase sigma-70 factor (ECF subfamily)
MKVEPLNKKKKACFANNNGDGVLQWEELALLSQTGDKRAYSQLLSNIIPYIKARLSSGFANYDWVEEVVQDVLISVHKSLATYSPDRPFKPWLNAIIHYRKADFLRKYYKNRDTNQSSRDNADVFDSNVTNYPLAGELKDIEKALATLPAKQQKLFKMVKIEGYSAAEVAVRMDMSVTAVKVSAHRAAEKLKGILAE